MTILFQAVMLLEFMFQGYCQYVYFSALMKPNRNPKIILLLFLAASCVEFISYKNLYIPWLNISTVILFSFIIGVLCYKAHIGIIMLHSCVTGCMVLLSELITLPWVSLIAKNDYIAPRAEIIELTISTFSKLLIFIACKLVQQITEKETFKAKSLWLFVVPLLSIVLVLIIYSLSDVRINSNDYHIVLAASSTIIPLINIVVFRVHEDHVKSANETYQRKLLEQKKELDYESYKLLQKNYEASRLLIHDIKHHLDVIGSMAEATELKQYLQSIREQAYFTDSQKLTGNKIVDIIIHQKAEICRSKGIKLCFTHNNIRFDFVEDADICCILSNLIDNAIESAELSSEKRIEVVFFSKSDNKLFFIEIENSCDNAPTIEENHLVTRKKDKANHGFGMLSVERTVKRYNGESVFQYEKKDKKFRVTVMIPG